MSIDLNIVIVEKIQIVMKNNPTLRFNQVLYGLSIVKSEGSSFYDKPEDVLKRIENSELYKKSLERGSFNGVC